MDFFLNKSSFKKNHLLQSPSMTRLIWSGNFVLGSLDHPNGVWGSKFSRFILKEWGAIRNFPVMVKVSWLEFSTALNGFGGGNTDTAGFSSTLPWLQVLLWSSCDGTGQSAQWRHRMGTGGFRCRCLTMIGHWVFSQRTAAQGCESGGVSQKPSF